MNKRQLASPASNAVYQAGSHTQNRLSSDDEMAVAMQTATAKKSTKVLLHSTALHMSRTLQEEANVLRKHILGEKAMHDPEKRDYINAVLLAIDEGDAELMAYYGFDLRYAWLNDVVATMIQGKPNVYIQVITAATVHDSTYEINVPLMELLQAIVKPLPHTTIVSMVDALPQASQHIPKNNAVCIPVNHLLDRIDELVTVLRGSRRGTVTTDTSGNVYFKPTKQLVTAAALQDRGRREEMLTYGVLLQHADGTPTSQMLDAAAFLEPSDDQAIHLFLLDSDLGEEQDKTYILLRALDIVRQELYHNFFFDSRRLSPELIVYGVATLFRRQTLRFLDLLDYYDEWQRFDPYEYAMRNYGETLLPEDDQIIHGIVEAFRYLNVEPGSLTHVADVGTGPNLYPLMLIAPYLKSDAKIDVLEFSEPNRTYLQKTINSTVRSSHRHIWEKFEQLMVEIGGDTYKGNEQAAKEKASIKFGNILDLPQGQYELLSSYFVSESIVDSTMPFRTAIQSLAKALSPDGTLVVAHMVGSEGWHAGKGTRFPAVNLSIEEIAQAYQDADMEFVVIPVGEDTTKKAREGYHGMAFVVAFHRPCSRAQQAALDRLGALPGSLRSTPSYDYSIEYCHIYTNESIGNEHALSIEQLDNISSKLDAELATYNLCVMVDDYTFPGENFDYSKLLEWMEGKDARPHFLVREAQLISSADEVLRIMAASKRKRELTSYVERKTYPCSLFIAAWYLARLGKLKSVPSTITSRGDRLINILPVRFEPFEREALEIIAKTPFRDCIQLITDVYLEGNTLPSK
jgi:hypothetical protein